MEQVSILTSAGLKRKDNEEEVGEEECNEGDSVEEVVAQSIEKDGEEPEPDSARPHVPRRTTAHLRRGKIVKRRKFKKSKKGKPTRGSSLQIHTTHHPQEEQPKLEPLTTLNPLPIDFLRGKATVDNGLAKKNRDEFWRNLQSRYKPVSAEQCKDLAYDAANEIDMNMVNRNLFAAPHTNNHALKLHQELENWKAQTGHKALKELRGKAVLRQEIKQAEHDFLKGYTGEGDAEEAVDVLLSLRWAARFIRNENLDLLGLGDGSGMALRQLVLELLPVVQPLLFAREIDD